jgi:hypothetical protein
MSDYLGNLAARALNLTEVVLPRVASRYEPAGTAAGQMFGSPYADLERQPVQTIPQDISKKSRLSTSERMLRVNPAPVLGGELEVEKVIPDSGSIQHSPLENRHMGTAIYETMPGNGSRSENAPLPGEVRHYGNAVSESSFDMEDAKDRQDEAIGSDIGESLGDIGEICPEIGRITRKTSLYPGSQRLVPTKIAVGQSPPERRSTTSLLEEKAARSKSSNSYFEHPSEAIIPCNDDISNEETHVGTIKHPASKDLQSSRAESYKISEKNKGVHQTEPSGARTVNLQPEQRSAPELQRNVDGAIQTTIKAGGSSKEAHFIESEPIMQTAAKFTSSLRNPIGWSDRIAQLGAQDSIVPPVSRNAPQKPRTSRIGQKFERGTTTNHPQYEAEPDIHVTIGRIEVRAAAPPSSPIQRRRMPPLMSLDDYLRQRTGGDGK